METLSIVGSICSILGLLIALFIVNQVISIKTTIHNNSPTSTHQEKNKVKGDQAGRDVHKTNE